MIAQHEVDLRSYDLILVNTSGGKDSSVAGLYVAKLAEAAGVLDRVLMVHATFAEEWPGTVEIVRQQAYQLSVPFLVVSRGESLLTYVRRRGKWPSSLQRYCTSDFKRAPIDKVITAKAPRSSEWTRRPFESRLNSRPRVLNVMGIRADESPARSKRVPFRRDPRRTNSARIVDEWLPIFRLTKQEVWDTIHENDIPIHQAYKLGMPRLSCMFCIFAPKAALVLAGKHNPEMLRAYVDVERETGHDFRVGLKIADVLAEVEAGAGSEPITDWRM